MGKYVLRRLALLPVTLFLVSITIFMLMRVMPGDVAEAILGAEGEGATSDEEVQKLREQLGLERPLLVQYTSWLKDLVTLDFGTSLWTRRSIRSELAARLPLTLELTILAMMFSLVIAIPIGVVSALMQDKPVDYVVRGFAITGVTMPTFWTGTLIVLILVTLFKWAPPIDFVYLWEDPVRNLKQFIFPAITLGYFHSAVLARMTRSSLLEVLRQDYIRTALAKGLTDGAMIRRHALKNAMLPIMTLVGVEFGGLLAGSVITETLFQIPGLGRAMAEAVLFRDFPFIQTIVVLVAATYSVVNLVVDLAYGWVNPKIVYD